MLGVDRKKGWTPCFMPLMGSEGSVCVVIVFAGHMLDAGRDIVPETHTCAGTM